MVKTLVLSGGGLKTISYIGAYKYLEELNYIPYINKIISNSGGSIIGFLILLGYSSNELSIFFKHLDLSKVYVFNANNILNFTNTYGIESVDRIGNIIKKFLKKKYNIEDISFKELYDKTGKKLEIIGTCLNTMTCDYFSIENTPNMSVLTAIKISFALPFLFKPVIHNDKYYVDGALTNNFPIDNCINNNKETMGMIVYEKNKFITINNLEDYVFTILKTNFCKQDNDKYIKYYDVTIEFCFDINPINFNLDKEDIKELIDIGYNFMKKQIKTKFSYMLKKPKMLLKHFV